VTAREVALEELGGPERALTALQPEIQRLFGHRSFRHSKRRLGAAITGYFLGTWLNGVDMLVLDDGGNYRLFNAGRKCEPLFDEVQLLGFVLGRVAELRADKNRNPLDSLKVVEWDTVFTPSQAFANAEAIVARHVAT